MFNLSEQDIHLSATADNKQQAIELVANALEKSGYVESGYLQGMLARESQTSTFLGNGIAIPHGTLDTRAMVKNTGVQVFQFPQGIEWGEGNTAYVVIGIAARSDEHLALLRQLTQVLGDEDKAAKLATLQDVKAFRAILMGEESLSVSADNLHLDVETQSLLTLTAINAGKLQQQGAVNNDFVSEVIASPALPLAEGLWITDSLSGSLKNALAFSRAKNAFELNHKNVKGVITVSAKDDGIHTLLARLLENDVQQTLLNGSAEQIVTALNGEETLSKTAESAVQNAAECQADNVVIGTFTVRNEHGLHARPTTNLVNVVKQFDAKISVQNLSRDTAAVSAKSLMKIVALGAVCGHRLRFVAEGNEAQQAIEAIQQAMMNGLGEHVSAVSPAEADSIEVQTATTPSNSAANQAESAVENVAENAVQGVEGIFVVQNEHGIHARPATILVNEAKKYQAAITVENLDRETAAVSAKSMMKVVALGAVKGHRLRFVATGDDAQNAIEGIGAAIAAGLGE